MEYDLKWNTFQENLVETFRDLGTFEHFADVTLVSDDQIQTSAHKIVLSACSPVLKSFLISNSHSHPLIFLHGIRNSELKSILHFMYNGETSILEDRIDDFLQVANELQLKDISKSEPEQKETEGKSQNENNGDSGEILKREKNEYDSKSEPTYTEEKIPTVVPDDNSCENMQQKKLTKNDIMPRDVADKKKQVKVRCPVCDAGFNSSTNLWRHTQLKHEGNKFSCKDCDRTFVQQVTLNQHVQSFHNGVRYKCSQCEKQFVQQSNLTQHRRSVHDGVRFPCNHCDFKAIQRGALNNHMIKKHAAI